MNRRQFISLPFGLAVAAWLPKARRPVRIQKWQEEVLTRGLAPLPGRQELHRLASDFDPFFVWRESERFDREVAAQMQRRIGMAMAERIDLEWGIA